MSQSRENKLCRLKKKEVIMQCVYNDEIDRESARVKE